MMRALLLCVFCIAMIPLPAWARAPGSFVDQLGEADVVFIGELTAYEDDFIKFSVTQMLRGQPPSPARFQFDNKLDGPLPEGINQYIVISQVVDDKVTPDSRAALCREVFTSWRYAGWLVFPIKGGKLDCTHMVRKGKGGVLMRVPVKVAELAKIVAKSPYRPARN